MEVFPIPNKASAIKRVRQNDKRRLRNLRRKKQIRELAKQLKDHLTAGQREQAKSLLPELMKAVDKAAQNHTIHPNKAARIKARFAKKVAGVA